MGKKYTIECIREEFAREGYILLSEVYEGAHQKLRCIHPNGQEYNISWSNWQQGKRGPRCGGHNKLTLEFVRSEFEKKGDTLLAKEYKNAQTKMDYICKNGHRHSISWNNWRSGKDGSRCPYCYGNIPFTIEGVREEFTKKGATLLTTVYINSGQKLDYICKRGHKTTTTLDNWRQDHDCKYCVGNVKHSIGFIRLEYAKRGFVLLSTVYVDNKTKLKYKCKRGHTHYMSYGKLKAGRKCPTCTIENNTDSGNPNWKGGISGDSYCPIWKDKEYAESIKQRDGYKCMNPCCNSKNPDNLTRHHINYDKQDCRLKNIITACTSCNPAANFDREFHEAWYKAIMYRRYGYTYEENK